MREAFRRVIRDAVAETLALLPVRVKRHIMSHFRRPVLWLLFHLETEPVTIARAGLPPHRFRMWLEWQGNVDYVLGVYEPEAVDSARRSVRPGSCCVDVGANLGYYTLSMAHWVGSDGLVVAFEPFPSNFEALKKNVRLNELRNVMLEPSAAADRNDSIQLTYGLEEKFSATPSVNGYAVHGTTQQIRVPARSLDDYLSGLGRAPDLIKIDVEGAELAVLQGARHTLEKVHPVLLIEIHGWGTPGSEEVLRFLDQFCYQIVLLGRKGREATVLCTNRSGKSRQENLG